MSYYLPIHFHVYFNYIKKNIGIPKYLIPNTLSCLPNLNLYLYIFIIFYQVLHLYRKLLMTTPGLD